MQDFVCVHAKFTNYVCHCEGAEAASKAWRSATEAIPFVHHHDRDCHATLIASLAMTSLLTRREYKMDSNQDFKIDEAEERRRAGIPAFVRAVLPRNLWENPLNWKRTKVAMGFTLMLATVGPATAFTISKKATPIEGIQVASLPTVSRSVSQAKATTQQPTASQSSTDANLPPYFRTVDSGQKCGDRKVEVGDPDTVPGYPKLTALLATNPCFNFGWIEENKHEYGGKVGVINYIPADHHKSGGQWSFPGASKDLVEGAKHVKSIMDMNEINGLLNAFTLDMVRKISGPEMVNEIKKLTAKLEQEQVKSKPQNRELDQAIKDEIFWNTLMRVASSEGLTIRLSDATREREAADKILGDFLLPDGTADRYKMILARMSPSDWEKFQMEYSLAKVPENEANPERLIVLEKRALSNLKDSRDIQAATERLKKYSPKTADRVLAELGLA